MPNPSILLYSCPRSRRQHCMTILTDSFNVLREGKTLLSEDLEPFESAPAHVLAALGFQLARKSELNSVERDVLALVGRKSPEAALYIARLSPGISDYLGQRDAHSAAPSSDRLQLLQRTTRDTEIGYEGINTLISNFVSGAISPELMSVWLMKVKLDGLSRNDIWDLTIAMRDSGRIFDYRALPELRKRRIIRRYPTGALSEKIALILPGLFASVFASVPFASPFLVARSLSFTGGTWDKLQSIPEFRFPLQGQEVIEAMQACGVAMSVTQGDLNPADRKMYQLRSVTGTVESTELIIASIASKQLAVPADMLLLDVRYGSGAFLHSRAEAEDTASQVAGVVQRGGVPCVPWYNDTPEPNGMAVGNALEVLEALQVMGQETKMNWDRRALLEQRRLVIATFVSLMESQFGSLGVDWKARAEENFESRLVLKGFVELLSAHGVGDSVIQSLLADPSAVLLPKTPGLPVHSAKDGKLVGLDQRRLGEFVNFTLGGGGNDFGLEFDAHAGVILNKRLGDSIAEGDALCSIYSAQLATRDNATLARECQTCFIVE